MTIDPPPGDTPAGELPAAGLRFLIIDDDDYMRSVVSRLLRRLGAADIVEAADGKQAIAEVRRENQRFDLLVCDIDMPGSDGIEFMRLAAEASIAIPLLLLSGKPPAMLRSAEVIAAEYGLTLVATAPKPPTVAILRQAAVDCKARSEPKRAGAPCSFDAAEIAEALQQRQFEPFFQPKIDLRSSALCGCEALARWRHQVHGVLAPGTFIAAIEAGGLMERMTWSLFEQAAQRCADWRRSGVAVPVSVNLSMSSLVDVGLADRLADLVRASGAMPSDFTLEVTETIAMTNVARCMESLVRLRLRGFGLSIDDFGTGFSSLQQLERVPYTELKIDRSFVNGAATHDRLRTVLESSIAIARRLGLASVAEGVETVDDWECLRECGCDIAQGYLIARPMAGAEFVDWAARWKRSPPLPPKTRAT